MLSQLKIVLNAILNLRSFILVKKLSRLHITIGTNTNLTSPS